MEKNITRMSLKSFIEKIPVDVVKFGIEPYIVPCPMHIHIGTPIYPESYRVVLKDGKYRIYLMVDYLCDGYSYLRTINSIDECVEYFAETAFNSFGSSKYDSFGWVHLKIGKYSREFKASPESPLNINTLTNYLYSWISSIGTININNIDEHFVDYYDGDEDDDSEIAQIE